MENKEKTTTTLWVIIGASYYRIHPPLTNSKESNLMREQSAVLLPARLRWHQPERIQKVGCLNHAPFTLGVFLQDAKLLLLRLLALLLLSLLLVSINSILHIQLLLLFTLDTETGKRSHLICRMHKNRTSTFTVPHVYMCRFTYMHEIITIKLLRDIRRQT